MAGGRPRALDDGKQREVCALVSAGCSLIAAARYVDCAPNTIRREMVRDAAFGQRFREARLAAQLNPLRAMRKAAANHWRAAAWMLERTDPDQFARRPPPAFRPKQAQALVDDVLAILGAEIENPFLLGRVSRQIRHLMQYSIDGVVHVERTNRKYREILRQLDGIDGQYEQHFDTQFTVPPRSRSKPPPAAAKRESTNGQPQEPAEGDRPASAADLAAILRVFRDGPPAANGQHLPAEATSPQPDHHPPPIPESPSP